MLTKQNSESMKEKAAALVRAENYLFALSLLERIVKIEPESYEHKQDLAKTYHQYGAFALKNENWEHGEMAYQFAVKIAPDNLEYKDSLCEFYIEYGYAQHQNKQYEAAISTYNKALKIKPDHHIIHFNIASVYSSWQRFDSAIQSLNFAIPLYNSELRANPDNEVVKKYAIASYSSIAVIQHHLGQYDYEIRTYLEALEITPSNKRFITNVVNAYLLLGQKYFTEKDYVKATDKFFMAHIFDPENQAARDELATIYIVRANANYAERAYEDAITFYSKALKLKPNLATLKELLGHALSKMGEKFFLENNFIKSVDYFSRAKDNYPLNRSIKAKFATALEKKSEIQRNNGDHIGAMSSLLQALDVSHNHSAVELCLHSSILWLMQKDAKCLELARKTMLELTTHIIFKGFEQNKSVELEALKMLDNILMGTDMVSSLTFKKIKKEACIQFIEENLHNWTGVISLTWEPCCSRKLFIIPDLHFSRIIVHKSNFKYTEYISCGNVSFSDITQILKKHTFDQIFLFCSYNSPYQKFSANMRDALVYRYKLLLNCCAVYNRLGVEGSYLTKEIIDIMMTKILLINNVRLEKGEPSSICNVM